MVLLIICMRVGVCVSKFCLYLVKWSPFIYFFIVFLIFAKCIALVLQNCYMNIMSVHSKFLFCSYSITVVEIRRKAGYIGLCVTAAKLHIDIRLKIKSGKIKHLETKQFFLYFYLCFFHFFLNFFDRLFT